jgi:hypothetical protein
MMTISTFPAGNVLKTYTRVMRGGFRQDDTRDGGAQVRDVVTISLEGKKKQIMDHAAREIIEKVKETR